MEKEICWAVAVGLEERKNALMIITDEDQEILTLHSACLPAGRFRSG